MMSRRCMTVVSSPLSLFNNVCASASVCFLSIAVVTDHWLYTTEHYPQADGSTTYRNIHSGLWRKCSDTTENRTVTSPCSHIDYFNQIDRDGLGPTDAILLSLRRAVMFPLVSLLMLYCGLLLCVLGHVKKRPFRAHRQLCILVSGVVYISAGSVSSVNFGVAMIRSFHKSSLKIEVNAVTNKTKRSFGEVLSGLVLLVGIIIYVGAVTEEAGSKKKGTAADEARFVYDYGASLHLVLCSFVGSELTGTLSVHLYISRRRRDCVTQLKRAAVIATGVSLIGGDRSRGLRATSGSRDDVVNNAMSGGQLRWPATGGDLSNYTFLSTSYSRDMINDVQYDPLGGGPVSITEAEQLACSFPYSMSVSNLINGGGHVSLEDMAARRITPV